MNLKYTLLITGNFKYFCDKAYLMLTILTIFFMKKGIIKFYFNSGFYEESSNCFFKIF